MKLFIDRLIEQIRIKNTPCIVGLDPALAKMPDHWLQSQGISKKSTLAECAEAIYQINLLTEHKDRQVNRISRRIKSR